MAILDISALRVLLVEDDAFVRRTIKTILNNMGRPELRDAGDGQEALTELATGFKPDFILCDVQMEPMDGISFIRHLRESKNQYFVKVPVIVLTAGSDTDTVFVVNSLGNCAYLLKPISPKALSDRIELLLQRTRPDAKINKIT